MTFAFVLGAMACGPDAEYVDDHDDDQAGCPNVFDPSGDRGIFATCGSGVRPPTPTFGSGIDGLASYAGQTTCSPTAKPGVTAFKDMILKAYPCTGNYGIVRACSSGGKSEHKEGRAWDWKLNYPHPAADAVIKWLLATDSHGNKFANARRVGLMYMVWNRRIWSSYRGTWRSYTGSNPHTDHIHFSFSWAGARKETSFWTKPTPPPAPANMPPVGYLDVANCTDGIVGWAQDPDTKSTAISVHIYVDSQPGQTGGRTYAIKADKYRADLCKAIGSCSHGFSMAIPAVLRDGKKHTVRAYGIDSKGGHNPQLTGVKSFTCQPKATTPPPPPTTPPPPPSTPPTPAPDAGSWLPDTVTTLADGGSIEPGQGSDAGVVPPTWNDDPDNYYAKGGCSVGLGTGAGLGQLVALLLPLALLGLCRRRRRRAEPSA